MCLVWTPEANSLVTVEGGCKSVMTIEIHNRELEQFLEERLKAGNFATMEAMLIDTLMPVQASPDGPADTQKLKAVAAAEGLRKLRKGISLDRPSGMSLREYAHIGHRY